MVKTILFPSAVLALAALGIVLVSEFTTAQESPVPPENPGPDIVAVITADPNLTTLVSALRAAELVEALKARGPFTLFAPSNAAFAKLPSGTLEALMMPENKRKLAAILKNHVIVGKVSSADMQGGKRRVLGGGRVEVAKDGGKVFFGKATVVVGDREASNGVVHLIDAVVMPD